MTKELLQDAFDAELKKYGGRMIIDKQPPQLRPIYTAFEDFFQKRIESLKTVENSTTKIISHIDFVNNDDFQAVAFMDETGGMVGLYRGLFLKLNILLFKMFIEKLVFNGKHSSFNFHIPVEYSKAIAAYLWRISVEFILNHEIAHISNGHIAYRKSISGKEFFFENDEQAKNESLIRHALELDADSRATAMLILKVDRTFGSFVKGRRVLSDPMKFVFSSLKRAMVFHVFALFIVFLLFEEVSFDKDNFLMRTHPPMPIRQLFLLKLLSGYFESKEKEGFVLDLNIKEIVANIGIEAQRVFYYEMNGKVYEWNEEKSVWTDYWNLLDKELTRLRTKLEPYIIKWTDNLFLSSRFKTMV